MRQVMNFLAALRLVLRVLYDVNRARLATGRSFIWWLRAGASSHPRECPIASSLDDGSVPVYGLYVEPDSDADAAALRELWRDLNPWDNPPYNSQVYAPNSFAEFVAAFDHEPEDPRSPFLRRWFLAVVP